MSSTLLVLESLESLNSLVLQASPELYMPQPKTPVPMTLPAFRFPALDQPAMSVSPPSKRVRTDFPRPRHQRHDAVSSTGRIHRNAQFYPPVPALPTDLTQLTPPALQSPTRRKRPSTLRLNTTRHVSSFSQPRPFTQYRPTTPESHSNAASVSLSACPTLEPDDSPARQSRQGPASALSYPSPALSPADPSPSFSKEIQGLGIVLRQPVHHESSLCSHPTKEDFTSTPIPNHTPAFSLSSQPNEEDDEDDEDFWTCIGSRKTSLTYPSIRLSSSSARPSTRDSMSSCQPFPTFRTSIVSETFNFTPPQTVKPSFTFRFPDPDPKRAARVFPDEEEEEEDDEGAAVLETITAYAAPSPIPPETDESLLGRSSPANTPAGLNPSTRCDTPQTPRSVHTPDLKTGLSCLVNGWLRSF